MNTAIRHEVAPGQFVTIGETFSEVLTEQIFERSELAYALVKDAIPSMLDVHKEFRRALPSTIEMMPAGRVGRVLTLDVDGLRVNYKRQHAYVKIRIDHEITALDDGRKTEAVRGAYLASAREFAAWIAERSTCSIGGPVVLRCFAETVLIEPGVASGGIPLVCVDMARDGIVAVLAAYYFLTPVGTIVRDRP